MKINCFEGEHRAVVDSVCGVTAEENYEQWVKASNPVLCQCAKARLDDMWLAITEMQIGGRALSEREYKRLGELPDPPPGPLSLRPVEPHCDICSAEIPYPIAPIMWRILKPFESKHFYLCTPCSELPDEKKREELGLPSESGRPKAIETPEICGRCKSAPARYEYSSRENGVSSKGYYCPPCLGLASREMYEAVSGRIPDAGRVRAMDSFKPLEFDRSGQAHAMKIAQRIIRGAEAMGGRMTGQPIFQDGHCPGRRCDMRFPHEQGKPDDKNSWVLKVSGHGVKFLDGELPRLCGKCKTEHRRGYSMRADDEILGLSAPFFLCTSCAESDALAPATEKPYAEDAMDFFMGRGRHKKPEAKK